MPLRIFLPALGLLLAACGQWKADSSELTARETAPAQGMACDACHGYPLKDRNHDFHLTKADVSQLPNGRITCLDCHSRSIRSEQVVLIDSLFRDTITAEGARTLDNPDPLARNSEGRIIRTQELAEIDTLHQTHPVVQPGRPITETGFHEYVTTLAHLNGTVDVAFHPRDSDPAKFDGDTAVYNPKQETCSAVACHPTVPKAFSFGSLAKGLPELK